MMKYFYLSTYPKIFLTMTGLHLKEFDNLVRQVQPGYQRAEMDRFNRPNRLRAIGGGDHFSLEND